MSVKREGVVSEYKCNKGYPKGCSWRMSTSDNYSGKMIFINGHLSVNILLERRLYDPKRFFPRYDLSFPVLYSGRNAAVELKKDS